QPWGVVKTALTKARRVGGAAPTAVMNMGATYTDLNIIVGDEVVVTRSIPIGGNALTSSVASVMNVPVEEAEQHKRHIDIAPAPTQHNDEFGVMSVADPAKQVTVPFVDELVRELRRSVLYFQSQAAEAGMSVSVEQVVLAGGGTQLGGLPDYLQERLGMDVVILDPFADQSRGNAGDWAGRGAEFAVAAGLALKEYN
ncbi:MAG: pilus assembly protein PilM, partial [Actinomycetota bacterium]